LERFGPYIRKSRESKGLTQAAVSDAAGITQGYLSGLEAGTNVGLPTAKLARLAAALGEDVGHLAALLAASTAVPKTIRVKGRWVRVAGPVGAGSPRDDEFSGEEVYIPFDVKGELIAYPVSGDSMASEGILHGDYVLVRHEPQPAAGEKVVAWLAKDGGMVLKTIKGKGKYRWLESDGWSHRMGDGDHIYGAFAGLYRKP